MSNNTIHVEATKELFISMLIKDLTLNDVISDLIDNSVDAANSNITKETPLSDFKINLKISKDKFTIEDNCGGITSKIARESAFVFGKPESYKNSNYSIGQYGIGMKRAFFKIGNKISIESRSKDSYFKLNIDVQNWREDDNWNFEFDILKENQKNDLKDTFTKIEITNIHTDIKERFINSTFQTIRNELALEHMFSINNGLKLTINDSNIPEPDLGIFNTNEVKPRIWQHKFENGLKVQVVVGISDADMNKGGWYIYCNNRMAVGPERSELTGWSKGGLQGMPLYHSQYNRFRGFVFFTAENSSLLPWNTTKTGMDLDSKYFLFVRNKLIEFGLEIKNTLDLIKKERDLDSNKRTVGNLVNKIQKTSVYEYRKTVNFEAPRGYVFPFDKVGKKEKETNTERIIYSRRKEKIKKVKDKTGISKNSEVGKFTFDYYYRNEIG